MEFKITEMWLSDSQRDLPGSERETVPKSDVQNGKEQKPTTCKVNCCCKWVGKFLG